MSETNKLCLTLIISGIIIVTSNYISQAKNSLIKLEEECIILRNKNEQQDKNYNEIKNINSLLAQQNLELKTENQNLIKKTQELIEENNELKITINNCNLKLNFLIEENNNNIKIIDKIKKTNDEILFEDELAKECYDNIPCNNIKKRTTNFLW